MFLDSIGTMKAKVVAWSVGLLMLGPVGVWVSNDVIVRCMNKVSNAGSPIQDVLLVSLSLSCYRALISRGG